MDALLVYSFNCWMDVEILRPDMDFLEQLLKYFPLNTCTFDILINTLDVSEPMIFLLELIIFLMNNFLVLFFIYF
jgi:hypothetical protein